METLSQYLRDMVRELDKDLLDDTPDDEKKETAEWAANKMTGFLLEGLEGFSEKTVKGIEAAFELRSSVTDLHGFFEDRFDDYYTREMLESIPAIVGRTMQLSRLVPKKMPSRSVNLCLSEATRSYVFGFWNASVALSGAAAEQGLREGVEEKLGLSPPKADELVEKARQLRLLDESHYQLATQVRRARNRVLHEGKPSNQRQAWDILFAARQVLTHLSRRR